MELINNKRKDVVPGVFDNSCILNLQLRLWDSYIALADVKPPLIEEGRWSRCGHPPSIS